MPTGYLSTTLASVAFISACGGHVQRTMIGGGTASVQARGAVDSAPATSVAVERGTYEVKMRFDVPRAQVIEWTVLCPGAAENGVVGETTDQYRARRIAELRAERHREREHVAAVSGMLVGAAAPDVSAHAHASGPAGHAHVQATVPGEAIGAVAGGAIADAMVSDHIELAPADVGAAHLRARVTLATLESGTCTVSAIADDVTVAGSYEVVRVRDPRAEARARAAADPTAQARVALQMRLREDALVTRYLLAHYLEGECHAKPGHREYVRTQPFVVRQQLKDYLIWLGARLRPPRPAPLPEEPGASPYDDGEWISGQWIWTGIEWSWTRGGWRDNSTPIVRDHRTSSDSDRDHRSDNWSSNTRDHRTSDPSRSDNWSSNTRDHRSETKSESKPSVRDHRDNDDDKEKDDDKKDNAPRVRDHRR
jgi:hypothetical protein